MADPTPAPAFNIGDVFTIMEDVLKFKDTHPNALNTIVAFAQLVKDIIAAFNAPKPTA